MVINVQFCIAYVIVDVLCLVLTIIIASNVRRDSGSELQVRNFLFMLTSNLTFVIFDALWAILIFSGLLRPSYLLLSIVNGINLTAIAFTAYFWLGFCLAYFESKVMNSRVLRLVTAIPALLVIAFHLIGFFTDLNLAFETDGSISYKPMHTAAVIVPMFYLAVATVIAIRQYLRAATNRQRHMSQVFMLFMVAPALSGIFDIFVPSMPVAAAGIIISLTLVMMSLQESRISTDALTGRNNRRRTEAFLDECISHASAEHPVYLFIIDLDDFKAINDTFGHLEGDRALQLMADALRSICMQTNAFAARWGGDEFVVIYEKDETIDAELFTKLIQDTLARSISDSNADFKLTCSIGYAVCKSPAETQVLLIADADKMLYSKKLEHR